MEVNTTVKINKNLDYLGLEDHSDLNRKNNLLKPIVHKDQQVMELNLELKPRKLKKLKATLYRPS